MKVLLQRVKCASVEINNEVRGKIDKGLLLFVGVGKESEEKHIKKLCDKICNLRIFEDENSKFNLSLKDIQGEVLVISQFTLHANCKKGRRPDFTKSADPKKAKKFYQDFINELKCPEIKNVESGEFGAHMNIALENDGPVTIMLDALQFS